MIKKEGARWQRCGDPLDGTKEGEVCGDQLLHLFQYSDPVSSNADLGPASLCVCCLPQSMFISRSKPEGEPFTGYPMSKLCVCVYPDPANC